MLVLLVLLAWLAGLATALASDLPLRIALQSLATARFTGSLLGLGAMSAVLLALAIVLFVPVGWLCFVLLRPRFARLQQGLTWHRLDQVNALRQLLVRVLAGSLARVAAIGLGCVAVVLAWGTAHALGAAPWVPWALPAFFGVLAGALACPAPAREGAAVRRRRAPILMLRALLALAVIAATLAGIATAAAGLLLSPARMAVPPVAVAPSAEHALRMQIGALNPLQLAPGQQVVVRFPPAEVQALLRLGLRRLDRQASLRVQAEPARGARGMSAGALAVAAGFRVPLQSWLPPRWRPEGRPFLNVALSLAAALRDGEIVVDRCVLRVGALDVPPGLCAELLGGWYLPASGRAPAATGDLPSLGALDALQVDAGGAALVYRRLELSDDTRQALLQLVGPGDAVVAAVRAQLLALQQHVPRLQASDDRFRDALQLAFRVARLRSRVGDAVAENQGAIIALAMVLGDPDVALAAGLPRDPAVLRLAERIGPAHLWGRADWARHFLISAALAQVATASLSDAAGVAKEQMDANGGSGFSFTDLLADRAGTAFGARLATDAEEANHVQSRILDHWHLADIAPSPAGLPEGLQADAFRAEFGQVGSARYRAVEAEIARRLQTAALCAQ